VSDGKRIQLQCTACGSYFRTTRRAKDTNCPQCGQRRYVPAHPEWEGPGTRTEKEEALRATHWMRCPKCGRTRTTPQREGTPTRCTGKLGCGASIRVRYVEGSTPPLNAQSQDQQALGTVTPPTPPRTAAGGTGGARPSRPRKARARRDVAPGSAAAIGRDNAASLRRERTAEQRAKRATERAASEESINAGAQGMSAIVDSARQIAAMIGKQSPRSPAMAATPVAVPKAPRALSIRCIPASQGDPYLCSWFAPYGRCNVGPVVLTIKGHGFCKVHKNAIELAAS